VERYFRIPVTSVLAVAFAIGLPVFAFSAEATLTTHDGRPIAWSDWVDDNAPVAVLLWASWVPNADETLAGIGELTAAAESRGLELVLVVVQEPLEEARDSLKGVNVIWYHDRYGHLLKDYRVVSIPRLLVIAEDGRAIERLEAKPQSLSVRGRD